MSTKERRRLTEEFKRETAHSDGLIHSGPHNPCVSGNADKPETNARGRWRLKSYGNKTYAFTPKMIEQDEPAHIGVTASSAVLVRIDGPFPLYAASKYATAAVGEALLNQSSQLLANQMAMEKLSKSENERRALIETESPKPSGSAMWKMPGRCSRNAKNGE